MKLDEAEQLIRTLSETRAVEVKRWFDPGSPSGKAKLVKGLQALRNFGGGYFVVGFDDSTMEPDIGNEPSDVKSRFHVDIVQEVVARHSSEPFDVEVLYPELNGRSYVVIAVPSGVITPVAVKRGVDNGSGHQLVAANDVFFRTLQANNRVSSAKIPFSDLPELVSICFDNREADIGRFLRRHLSGLSPDVLRTFVKEIGGQATARPSVDEALVMLLDDGKARFSQAVLDRQVTLPPHGSFEVGLIMMGSHTSASITDRQFLGLLERSNPSLTGWPIWLDSSNFHEALDRPYVLDDGWEALIVSLESGWMSDYIDFMRKEPSGRFYLFRGLQDDLSNTERAPQPLTELDFGLAVLRTAEAIAVGREFATALGYNVDDTVLEFAFRWQGLKGRTLSAWANPSRHLSAKRRAMQDAITCRVSVPLISAPETTVEQTHAVVSRLFALFDGFELSIQVVDDLVMRLLERRL